MFIRYLHIQIIILLNLSLAAQQANNHMTYQRFEGSSDTSEMKANFIRQNDQISGNYEVAFPDSTVTYEVAGEVDTDNRTSLNPYGEETPALEGVLVDDRFTGIWNYGAGMERVELTELYPPGSIPLDVYYLHSEENLIAEHPETPSAEIELTMAYPVVNRHVSPEVTGKIRQIIASHYTDKPEVTIPDSVLVAAEQDFYTLYGEMRSEDWEEMSALLNWSQENSMSVLYNSNGLLSLEYFNYVYTGGAHGLITIDHDIIDLNTGSILTPDQIFREDYPEQLSKLLTAQLRLDNDIPDSISLTDAGYFVEKIDPTENIYVNGSGIGFSYASYEIAPFSMGIPQVFLSYKQIKSLLRKGTPVWQLTLN
jgi:hypothetical protein